MTISLRDIQPTDKAFLFTVYASMRAEEMALVDWTMEAKDEFLWMQFEAQDLYYKVNFRDAEYQIIELEKKPVGRLYIHRRKHEILIMDIALLPEYRRQGIGTSLLEVILEEGKHQRLPVTIHVERSNPAIHLFERFGFRQAEDQGVYYLMQWNHKIMERGQSVG